jgi:hypothetical protein
VNIHSLYISTLNWNGISLLHVWTLYMSYQTESPLKKKSNWD